jgi:hypothetical protein
LTIRAQYKNEKYFKKEITRLEDWIKTDIEDNEKYKKEHGDITPFHYRSTGCLYDQIAECMYSMGEPV